MVYTTNATVMWHPQFNFQSLPFLSCLFYHSKCQVQFCRNNVVKSSALSFISWVPRSVCPSIPNILPMLPKDYFTKVPSRGVGLVTPAQDSPSTYVTCTRQETLHALYPQPPPDVLLRPPFASRGVHDSCDGVVAVSRRHFVVHGPSCGPIMQCVRRSESPPFVTRVSEGIPWAHIVPTSPSPARCNLDVMWARALVSGPLIGEGDRLWVDGVGEVVLQESRVSWRSPY